ncbi:hypothetical protein [Ktedonobacter robiniae]|uniref:Uncharacterized protein n=1 Tax=Ktedonobacter robiniae TaxID=2778365 RepID=A0ABQ3UGK6_9CHLR|nr:hypothetical protein [Ktedonobacter robiniae]GHO51550.1 hypothetical protein KSB_00250 [Ktedonobacter robiniae]
MTRSLQKDCSEYIEDLDITMESLRDWEGFSDRALAYEMFLNTYRDTCARGRRDIEHIRGALERLEKELAWHQQRYETFRHKRNESK